MQNNVLDKKFYSQVKEILENARKKTYNAINFAMVEAYWEIGKSIVEKQEGNYKAEYGKQIIKELAKLLTYDYGKGFDESNLRRMRQFYLLFQKRDTLRHELSWSHYRLIMKVKNEKARQFYIEETIKSNWSTRQLERQINTFSYERLIASKGNYDVVEDTSKKEPNKKLTDVIRDPYVLEFLGLEGNPSFYESDLEQSLINHLQKFLLELGRGFSFVARQQHINFDGRHFYIDLVFYNYILKCFVLVDLKTGDLTHQDIGQMQMYVNYYKKNKLNEGDNPPIGIILCSDKSDTLVRYTLPEEQNQIYASKYMLYIPTEEELRKEIRLERENLENI